ncbi:MAG: TIGR01212 family radical SAM protein [Bacteroidia bacterium]|nr:TIGR01212 family radical SAM protein [Bacteroidia bacterium]
MQYPWGDSRRYNSYAGYFKRLYGQRVQKVAINAGFTCPNRDGTVSYSGCAYCNNDAFNPSYCKPEKDISQQIKEGIEFHHKRYMRAEKYLAYFQPYSNTYADIGLLKKKYEEALNYPGVIGLVISTRPDCINDEKLSYIAKLAEKCYILIEYGIESCYNKTLKIINRGHTFEQSVEAIERTVKYGIKTGIHLLFGLPGESKDEMLIEAETISKLPVNNVKFHQLQVLNNTSMAEEYKQNPEQFTLFSMEEYFDFLISFIERLNPAFVIERFTAEVPPRFLIAPNWGTLRNDQILSLFEKKMEEKNSWQGRLFQCF